MSNKGEEVSDSFSFAYANILKPHHNFFVKPIFSLVIRAVPLRKIFYANLGGTNDSSEEIESEISMWLVGLESVVETILHFYESMGLPT